MIFSTNQTSHFSLTILKFFSETFIYSQCEDFGYIGSKKSLIILFHMYRNDEIHEEFKTLGDVVIKYVVFVHRGVS